MNFLEKVFGRNLDVWGELAGRALVRCVKTMCQTAVATIGSACVLGDVDWLMVLSASALAGILSLLTSVAGLPEVDETKYDYSFEDDECDDEQEFPTAEEEKDLY